MAWNFKNITPTMRKKLDKAVILCAKGISKRPIAKQLKVDRNDFSVVFASKKVPTFAVADKIAKETLKKKLTFEQVKKKYGQPGLQALWQYHRLLEIKRFDDLGEKVYKMRYDDNGEVTMSFENIARKLKGRVVIVGIGNSLRGDDGAGPALIREMRPLVSEENSKITLIDAGEAPENYLQKILDPEPDTILLVDAADFKAPPGSFRSIESQESLEQGLSTHNASLKLTIDFLKMSTGAEILLLGIQPENTYLGESLSGPVRNTIKKIALSLAEENHA